MTVEDVESSSRRWRILFEERHGAGAYERLLAELGQPCVTFAAIAKRLGVTRERVRQWQLALLPDAPRGHERQRQCARWRHKRRLFADPLFREFHRHVTAHIGPGRIELIGASDGFRRRTVRIDGRAIALREAQRRVAEWNPAGPPAYSLAAAHDVADFIYYRLTATEFLLLPTAELRLYGATFIDVPGSPLGVYKNSCKALMSATECQSV